MSAKVTEFMLNWSGIDYAKIIFDNEGVLHSKRDLKTNYWSPMKNLDNDDMIYQIPLIEIFHNLKEIAQADWVGDEITLSYGARYKKHITIEGIVNGKKMTSQIWAGRDIKSPVDIIIMDKEIIGFYCASRGGSTILVKPGYEDLTPLKYWNAPLLSKSSYGINHLGVSFVPMKDGTKLATEVWLPQEISENTKVPTILVRTPYGRSGFSIPNLRFVERGYAVIIQDVRGREDSEGQWRPHYYEIEDGNDTLNWIADQPWSNGDVGMIGASYLGYVQWAAAASGNPHLKAIVSQVCVGTPFGDIPRQGGTFLSGTLAWAFAMRDKRADFREAERNDWDDILSIRPLKDITKKTLGKEIRFWNEWLEHPNYDDFWRNLDWSIHGDKIDVPSLLISGWYDDDGAGTSEAWEMNMKNNRKNQKLILGPWLHGFNTTRDINNIPFSNDAISYELEPTYLKWFDKFLKGIDNGIEKENKVHYYMVGENQWKTSDSWPPKKTKLTNLYIHSNGNAQTSSGDGLLKTISPIKQPNDSYLFDPNDPAPFLIDVSENEMSVPENYKDVEKRDDVLVYTSEPLNQDISIAGDIYATLYASSSARDTDWVVRLTDVDEDGNSIRLSDGVIRARYRNSFENPTLIEPGKIEKYQIRMSKIANVFKKGHRIRIEVTSGMENYSFPNHNTGNDPATDTEVILATQRVFHSSEYPSHVKLPILHGKLD